MATNRITRKDLDALGDFCGVEYMRAAKGVKK